MSNDYDDDNDNNKADISVCVYAWLHCGHGTARQHVSQVVL